MKNLKRRYGNSYGIEASAVGLYGTALSEPQKEQFYQAALRWFEKKRVVPQHLCVVGAGFPKSTNLKKNQQRLQKIGFKSVRGIDVLSLPFDNRWKRHLDQLGAGFNFYGAYWDSCLTARTSVESLSHEFLCSTVSEMVEILKPEYGIGFRRDVGLGPTCYVGGLVQGLYGETDEEEEEADNIRGWWMYGLSQSMWGQGILRDVYPWNFLTKPLLSSNVGKITLEEWIREQPEHRGRLIPVGHMQLWELPDAAIPAVRQILWDAGCILDHAKLDNEREESFKASSPMTREEALAKALEAFGFESPDDVEVLDAKDPQNIRHLTDGQVGKIMKEHKSKRPKK